MTRALSPRAQALIALDLDAIVAVPVRLPRRRSRPRAALNLVALLGVPLLLIAGLLRLAGVHLP